MYQIPRISKKQSTVTANMRNAAVISIFYSTGLRLNEIVDLKVGNIDLKTGRLDSFGEKE